MTHALNTTLSTAVQTGGASLVRVEGRRRYPSTGVRFTDGVIVTAHHALERDGDISVVFPDGTERSATLAGRDPSTDLAALRLEGADTSPAPAWAELDGLAVGHLVLALGRPGKTVRASFGIVGTLGESFRTPAGGKVERFLSPDLDLPRGFSGGPLVDLEGRVLGINTSGLLRGTTLTLPTVTVRRVVETLLSRGQVQRGFLGVTSQPVRLPEKLAAAAGQASGLVVLGVQPDGPADKAGITLGDVLIGLDGRPVTDLGDLLELLADDRVGKSATLRIARAGQIEERGVTIGARSSS